MTKKGWKKKLQKLEKIEKFRHGGVAAAAAAGYKIYVVGAVAVVLHFWWPSHSLGIGCHFLAFCRFFLNVGASVGGFSSSVVVVVLGWAGVNSLGGAGVGGFEVMYFCRAGKGRWLNRNLVLTWFSPVIQGVHLKFLVASSFHLLSLGRRFTLRVTQIPASVTTMCSFVCVSRPTRDTRVTKGLRCSTQQRAVLPTLPLPVEGGFPALPGTCTSRTASNFHWQLSGRICWRPMPCVPLPMPTKEGPVSSGVGCFSLPTHWCTRAQVLEWSGLCVPVRGMTLHRTGLRTQFRHCLVFADLPADGFHEVLVAGSPSLCKVSATCPISFVHALKLAIAQVPRAVPFPDVIVMRRTPVAVSAAITPTGVGPVLPFALEEEVVKLKHTLDRIHGCPFGLRMFIIPSPAFHTVCTPRSC